MAPARALGCIAALAATALSLAPPAGAQPPQPDWDHYTTVNTSDYTVAIPTSGYNGAVSSVQFSTPVGQNCSIVINIRGMWDTATCTGPIPGTNHTSVTASYLEAGTFDDTTPSPGQAKLLPAGTKITFTRGIWTGNCAVDHTMTACIVTTTEQPGQTTPNTPHGFTLGPNTSTTF